MVQLGHVSAPSAPPDSLAAKAYLIHPKADVWLMGGVSLACIPAFWALGIGVEQVFSRIWWMLILFSFPHFMVSYAMFYGRGGPWQKHQFVAVWIPLALSAATGFAVWSAPPEPMAWICQGTLALLYWHFLKQAYGVALWLGSVKGRPLGKDKKHLLLTGLILLGAYGFFSVQETSKLDLAFFRFPTPRLDLGPWPMRLAGAFGYGALLVFVFQQLREWRQKTPSDFGWQGYVPIVALLTWFDPLFAFSPVKLLVPIFHGMQYLPFPARVQANRDPKPWMRGLFWVAMIGAGYLGFEWIPRHVVDRSPVPIATRVFAFFLIFFNVHHFFIDGVIWRFRDPEVLRRLGAGRS